MLYINDSCDVLSLQKDLTVTLEQNLENDFQHMEIQIHANMS